MRPLELFLYAMFRTQFCTKKRTHTGDNSLLSVVIPLWKFSNNAKDKSTFGCVTIIF